MLTCWLVFYRMRFSTWIWWTESWKLVIQAEKHKKTRNNFERYKCTPLNGTPRFLLFILRFNFVFRNVIHSKRLRIELFMATSLRVIRFQHAKILVWKIIVLYPVTAMRWGIFFHLLLQIIFFKPYSNWVVKYWGRRRSFSIFSVSKYYCKWKRKYCFFLNAHIKQRGNVHCSQFK